jgi:hypothetical protein
MIDNRDFVQVRKIRKNFPDENSTIMIFRSIDHPKAPPRAKTVRAETVISGYFIKQVGENQVQLIIISQTDVKV